MGLPIKFLASTVDIKNDSASRIEACHQQLELIPKLKSVDFSKI